jgi:membrane protease YdiL (CAAX protease family)
MEDTTISTAPRKRRRRRGAIAQVLLFTSIWSTLAGLFGLLAALPTLLAAFERHGLGLPSLGRRVSDQLDPGELTAILSTSSGTTLAVAAATALATILSVWVMRRFFGGPALLDLGLRRRPGWLLDTAVGLALGPALFLAILLLLVAVGWASVARGTIGARELVMAFVTFVLVAFSEELFARGWVLQVLERGRGTRAAVIGSAATFALLHAFNPGFGLTALLGLFLAGLLFAQAYLTTRQLWLPMALHLSWNFSEGPLFGFPVSGLPAEGLLRVTPTGPDVMTGGAFGPEAGLVVVVGIALASASIYALGRWRPIQTPPLPRQGEGVGG